MMELAETTCSTGIDFEEECYEFVLDELMAQDALPASDEEIRLWSYRAYYVTAARCLHGGSGRAAAKQAALSVALSVAAYLAHQATAGNSTEKNAHNL